MNPKFTKKHYEVISEILASKLEVYKDEPKKKAAVISLVNDFTYIFEKDNKSFDYKIFLNKTLKKIKDSI